MDSNGDFVVVWQGPDADSSGVFGQRYNPTGTAAAGEFHVNTTTTGAQGSPDTAMAPGGSFVVVWQGPDADADGIWARQYDAAGTPQGGEIAVNITTTTGNQSAPAVGVDGSGNFVVTWQGPDSDADGIFAQRFNNSGTPQGGEIAVNATSAGDQVSPAIAVVSGGGFVVVWRSPDADGNGVFARLFDAAGAPVTGEIAVNATTTDNQGAPTVSVASNGDFVVAWQTYGQDIVGGGIYARRFDASGNALADEFAVNEYMSNDQLFPSIAVGSDGRLVLVWQSQGQDSSGFGVFAQRYDASGNPLGVRPW
jgi:hypothetical protein